VEIIEVVVNVLMGAVETVASGKSDKKFGIFGWIIVTLLILGLFLFTLIMSQ